MKFDILSLFPAYFQGPFSESMIKRAQEKGLCEIRLVDIRDFSKDRHNRVDDTPYGGGPGMVMSPEPLLAAIRASKTRDSKVVYLSPQGKKLDAQKCRELAGNRHLIFVCGHYEGIDARVIDSEIDEELSIGDYVLTNGCLAACVAVDAILRFLPGVLGDAQSSLDDSFEQGLFDWPQYTRPEEIEGMRVPSVLLSGDHKKISDWRRKRALEKTRKIRPELYYDWITDEDEPLESLVSIELNEIVFGVQDLKSCEQYYRNLFGKSIVSKSFEKVSLTFVNVKIVLTETETKLSLDSTSCIKVVMEKDFFHRLLRRVNDAKVIEKTPLSCFFMAPDGIKWIIVCKD